MGLGEVRQKIQIQAFAVRRTASYHIQEAWYRTDAEMGFTKLAPLSEQEKRMPLTERIKLGLFPNTYENIFRK